MTPGLPVHIEEKSCAHCTNVIHHEANPFSRASHFAMALTPMALGVAFVLIRDAVEPAWFRLGVFGIFLFGVGSAVMLLRSIEAALDWEERRSK